MPLEQKIKHEDGTTILVWHLTEDLQFFIDALCLSQNSIDLINDYSAKRKLEWLSARYLFKLMVIDFVAEDLYKDQFGKPFIKDSSQYVSISHSHEYACIIISNRIVGIDIQKLHDNIEKIAHKFISTEENLSVIGVNKLQNMHIIWGAKESMYKGYGKKELGFVRHIFVHPFSIKGRTTSFRGSVRKGGLEEDYTLFTRSINDYVLVYALQN